MGSFPNLAAVQSREKFSCDFMSAYSKHHSPTSKTKKIIQSLFAIKSVNRSSGNINPNLHQKTELTGWKINFSTKLLIHHFLENNHDMAHWLLLVRL